MDTKQILKGLKAEVKRLELVISILSSGSIGATTKTGRQKRSMSAAEKNRRSKAAKARWAKRKKAEKGD